MNPQYSFLKSAFKWTNSFQMLVHNWPFHNFKIVFKDTGNIFYGEAILFIPIGLDYARKWKNTCIATRTPAYTMDPTSLTQLQSVNEHSKRGKSCRLRRKLIREITIYKANAQISLNFMVKFFEMHRLRSLKFCVVAQSHLSSLFSLSSCSQFLHLEKSFHMHTHTHQPFVSEKKKGREGKELWQGKHFTTE